MKIWIWIWILAVSFFIPAGPGSVAAGEAVGEDSVVYKSASCNCCDKWVSYMDGKGYSLKTKDVPRSALMRLKARLGLRQNQASCHTAIIEGYVIEGHVPAEDVARLLKERPDAVGLTVPGMPIGSPGMEAGDRKEPYEVFLIGKDGSAQVFARHN